MKTTKKHEKTVIVSTRVGESSPFGEPHDVKPFDCDTAPAESNEIKRSAIIRSGQTAGVRFFDTDELKERYSNFIKIDPEAPLTFLGRTIDDLNS